MIVDSSIMPIKDNTLDYVNVCKYKVHIPFIINALSKNPICINKCYGLNIVTRKLVKLGDSVGILIVQSISENQNPINVKNIFIDWKSVTIKKFNEKLYNVIPKHHVVGGLKYWILYHLYSYQYGLIVINKKCSAIIYQ